MALEKLFGPSLLTASKAEVPTNSLAGPDKVIGIYFSAHWCPPCRGFTPILAKFYQDWKQTPKASLLEIVFVSSDRDSAQFDEYFGEMPWHAVPYSDRGKKGELSRKFKVSGIPTLVFIDGQSGKLITMDGRKIVSEDPRGENFPWKPKPLQELLGTEFINNSGETVPASALDGKVVGLYFSAHWCPPCRSFTPTLIRVYNKLLTKGKNIQIIFCSSDHDQDSFKEYFGTMPWLAIPLNDERKGALASYFGVSGIPKLVFLDENFKTITEDGRMAVSADNDGDDFPWKYKSLNMLKEQFGRYLNEAVCLIYFTDGSAEQVTAAYDALQGIADKARADAEAHDEEQPLHFFVAANDDDICDTVVHFLKLPRSRPAVAIMDCSSRSWYYHDGTASAAELEAWIGQFNAGSLEKRVIEPPK